MDKAHSTSTDRKQVGNSYALSDLTRSIEKHITHTYSGVYRIVAELNKLNHYVQSGHCYPLLVEKKDGRIIAEMRGFMGRSVFRRVEARFRDTLGRPIEDGMQVLMRCRVNYHSVRGLSLQVLDIDPSYTVGEMHRQRQEAIRKLKNEGLFAANKSHSPPMLIRRLAVISVVTSKGWQDFSSIVDRSPYARAIRRELFPSILQGDAAVKQIMAALQSIGARADEFDAVAIIRGGGGETGLDCYDHYDLAKKICTFPLPVLTGVGHASNLTVSEQVAFRNLITPSELAQFVVDGFRNFDDRLSKAARTLRLIGRNTLGSARERLDTLGHRMSQSTRDMTHDERTALSKMTHQLEFHTERLTTSHRYRLVSAWPSRLKSASDLITDHTQRLQTAVDQLPRVASRATSARVEALAHLDEKVRILDPVRMMKRGFSMVAANGQTVTNAADIKPGDRVDIRFARGTAEAEIRKTDPK